MEDKDVGKMYSVIDFCIEVEQEKIEGKGEDGYFFSVQEQKAVFGVFDGCGGSGAKRYESMEGKTGAYMASRVIAGAVKEWFHSPGFARNNRPDTESLGAVMKNFLDICSREGKSTSTVKGKLSKSFPTTAAILACAPTEDGVELSCIWAGDSRCYLLDASGLKQLTDDDIDGLDPMENLTADGVLNNVICASEKIHLHEKRLSLHGPCLVFAATDGCFGYLKTPMEFEYLLLDTLIRSENVFTWETQLKDYLKKTAGDDFTLCGASIGYQSFGNLQRLLAARREAVFSEYIHPSRNGEDVMTLWKQYAKDYMTFLNPVSLKTDVNENKAGKRHDCDPDTTAAAIPNSTRIGAIGDTRKETEKKSSRQEGSVKKGFQVPQDLD